MQRSHVLRWFALVLALFSFQCLESLSDDCRKTRTCETAPQLGADCRWHYADGGIWEGGPRFKDGLWTWPDGKVTATQRLVCPDAGVLGDAGLGPIGVGNCGPAKECDPGLICDEALDRCVRCLGDSQCAEASDSSRGALPVCDTRIRDCVVCLNDEDCARPGLPPDLHCKIDNSAPANNRCVACVNTRDCKVEGEVCDPSSNQCTAQCTGEGQCNAPKPICSSPTGGGGLCVQCLEQGHCDSPTPQCNTARKECVQCVDSSACINGQVCSNANRCVDCVDDSTCAQGSHCDPATNKCVACVDSSQCTSVENSRCNVVTHQCATCNDHSQCEAPFSVCDVPRGGKCVQCVNDETCPQGSVCDVANGTCVGCVDNADCFVDPTAARCDTTTKRCAPCGGNGQCLGKFNGKNLCRTPGPLNGECVECITANDCAGDVTRSRCDTSPGLCIGCQVDGDCNAIAGKRACLGGGAPRCVECTSATHCLGNVNGPACNTLTNTCVQCVVDGDCTAPGRSRCVANQCQPCVNDGANNHCGHIRNGQTILGVCDLSGGANAGVCVQCTGNERAACAGNVCNSLTKTCTMFAVGSAATCLDCVSDAHCAAGDRCVMETFGTPATNLGFSCFNLNPTGNCPGGPYEGDASVTTIDGAAANVCLLRRSTCAAVNQSPSRPCTVDADCGEPNLDDGRCDTDQGLCTLPCASALDCPGGVNSTCSIGVCLL
jgi:hypothetical protein